MLRLLNLLLLFFLASACVSTSPMNMVSKVDLDCEILEDASFNGFFAVECQLKNLTDLKQTVQISFVRFPNYHEDMVMLVPNYEYQQKLAYQNTFRSGGSLHFAPLASALTGKTNARAISALIAQVAKRGKALDSQSQMGYEKNFLLREELQLEPHQTIKTIVLMQKKRQLSRLPLDIEISVSKPSESILTRPL